MILCMALWGGGAFAQNMPCSAACGFQEKGYGGYGQSLIDPSLSQSLTSADPEVVRWVQHHLEQKFGKNYSQVVPSQKLDFLSNVPDKRYGLEKITEAVWQLEYKDENIPGDERFGKSEALDKIALPDPENNLKDKDFTSFDLEKELRDIPEIRKEMEKDLNNDLMSEIIEEPMPGKDL